MPKQRKSQNEMKLNNKSAKHSEKEEKTDDLERDIKDDTNKKMKSAVPSKNEESSHPKRIFENKTPWIALLIGFCFLVSASCILMGSATYTYTQYETKVRLAEQETKRLELNTTKEMNAAAEYTKQSEINRQQEEKRLDKELNMKKIEANMKTFEKSAELVQQMSKDGDKDAMAYFIKIMGGQRPQLEGGEHEKVPGDTKVEGDEKHKYDDEL